MEDPPKKAKGRKLTEGGQRIVDALRKGERLMVTYPDPTKANTKRSYALLPSGIGVTEAAHYAVRHLLQPVEDGLLPGASQTFTLKGEPRA